MVIDMEKTMTCLKGILKEESHGVYDVASSFWSLERLVRSLISPEVNTHVSALGLGPVSPGDISKVSELCATVLAFDVAVTPEAFQLADTLGVKVICVKSIELLVRQFKELGEEEEEKEAESSCILSIMPNCVLNEEDPILIGVYVVKGLVRVGTPLCVPQRAFFHVGRVVWIEDEGLPVMVAARQGHKAIIKIVVADPKTQQPKLGRDFFVEDELVSRISQGSISTEKDQ